MGFFKSIFSEPDGKWSFARVATALLILMALAWVTRLVWMNKTLPDFSGLTLFISTIYGLNKAGSILNSTIGDSKPGGNE